MRRKVGRKDLNNEIGIYKIIETKIKIIYEGNAPLHRAW